LEVLRGEGGVTPLSAPERAVARGNALATLRPDAHPQIVYSADVGQRRDGYLLIGELTINGVSRERTVPVSCGRQGRQTTFTVSATVRHSEHDLQPYSLMMGTLKVADEVRVDFAAAAEIPL
jgi:polyisoprenoid-binding protein YceI